MSYIEMSIEDALQLCGKNARVLISIRDLEKEVGEIIFIKKDRKEYKNIFQDVQTVASKTDDFVKQLQLYTEKQDIYNIKPFGLQKIVLLRE